MGHKVACITQDRDLLLNVFNDMKLTHKQNVTLFCFRFPIKCMHTFETLVEVTISPLSASIVTLASNYLCC